MSVTSVSVQVSSCLSGASVCIQLVCHLFTADQHVKILDCIPQCTVTEVWPQANKTNFLERSFNRRYAMQDEMCKDRLVRMHDLPILLKSLSFGSRVLSCTFCVIHLHQQSCAGFCFSHHSPKLVRGWSLLRQCQPGQRLRTRGLGGIGQANKLLPKHLLPSTSLLPASVPKLGLEQSTPNVLASCLLQS